MTKFVTPAGKEIVAYHDPMGSHVKVKFTSGGELPAELAGLFTSKTFAEKAIISYLDKVTKESPKANAKEK